MMMNNKFDSESKLKTLSDESSEDDVMIVKINVTSAINNNRKINNQNTQKKTSIKQNKNKKTQDVDKLKNRENFLNQISDVNIENVHDKLMKFAHKCALKHMIQTIPERKRRNCKLCTSKKVRKLTKFCCKTCNKSLCSVPCFSNYHIALWQMSSDSDC
ncbi:hypothetical protein A3Q56_03569 [Intoshia linei]|uniref:PiggyBac transposable element-derived protein 4 C-terminal zinc-finger domain-containing protein n=1 Tax=Intoshia linei TaxID=1819745 RepID=A0A177B328_9BILA|nr:hypothetical protein A3Q56_03569 [Intoshia linei]